MSSQSPYVVKDLDESTWEDFVSLMERPECEGCFCTYWEIPSDEEWDKRTPAQRRERKLELLKEGRTHGVLLCEAGKAIGWCQYGHRSYFTKLNRRPQYAKTQYDDVWSITCFLVAKEHRLKGLAGVLLREVVSRLSAMHAPAVEAYPRRGKQEDAEVWTGPIDVFLGAGFKVHIDDEAKPVVRLDLTKKG